MTTRASTYPLRPPVSIKSEVEQLAAAEGTSLLTLRAVAVTSAGTTGGPQARAD